VNSHCYRTPVQVYKGGEGGGVATVTFLERRKKGASLPLVTKTNIDTGKKYWRKEVLSSPIQWGGGGGGKKSGFL